jgi:putative ABC transport system permease protein
MPLLARLRNLWRPTTLEREFDAELQFHFDMRVERNLRHGMTPPEAQTEARRHMGSTLRAREGMHEAHVVSWLASIGREVTYAARMLVRQPGFTAVAVLTIALGIGANTAIYSVLQAVWIDAVPFRDPGRLVVVQQFQRSWSEFAELREGSQSFADLVPFQRRAEVVQVGDQREFLGAIGVTDALFPALGVAPLLGRPITAADLEAGAAPVVLLTHDFWQNRFGGDRDVVGRTMRMRPNIGGTRVDRVATIIGVMPADANVTDWESAFWMPVSAFDRTSVRGVDRMVGRLRPGVSLPAAREEVYAMLRRMDARRGDAFDPASINMLGLREDVVGAEIGQSLFLLLGATGIVLLIACANVANLLLARGLDLRKEMAVRSAIGAGRARLIRQALVENSLLALAGCALGVAIAAAGRGALVAIMPYEVPRSEAIAIDWRVMLFSALLAAGTAILTGLLPSLRSSAVRPAAVLTSAASQATTTPRRRVAHALVAGEVALSVVVLMAAALLVGSFLKLTAVDPGFTPRNVVSFRADPVSLTGDLTTGTALRLLDELTHAPDVISAAITSVVPFEGGDGFAAGVRVPGESKDLMVNTRAVSAGYFRTIGMTLRSGRDFSPADGPGAPPVVIVNERTARHLWPGQPAVGQRLQVWGLTNYHTPAGPVRGAPAVVIGVVNDARYAALDRDPEIEVYASLPQSAKVQGQASHVFVVRTTGAPVQVIQRLEPRIKELTGNAVSTLTALDTFISRSVHLPRFRALLFGLMGLLVVVLTAVGVFSVTAHVVAQRRREMGIRMAIGAQAGEVFRLTIRQTAVPVLAGAALGAVGAFATATLVAQFLYATTPRDPFTFAGAVVGVIVVAIVAATVPARRALRINPLDVLRLE